MFLWPVTQSIAASLHKDELTRQLSTTSSTGSLTSLEVAHINSHVTPDTRRSPEPNSFVNIPLHGKDGQNMCDNCRIVADALTGDST